jgi:ABC-type multidrug transport system ATPase subunit
MVQEIPMILAINDLKLSIDGTPVLHDVHLSLDAGEVYGLLGPNGAGKSTTIAAAVGLLPADAGTVAVFGQDPRREPDAVRARIGVLPERNGFYDWMNGPAYLGFFAALYGREVSMTALEAMLARVGLAPRPGQRIGTYSRGMRQRLGLARALIAEPKLLVLDEPTNGLDPRGRRDVHDLLAGLAQEGTAILLCTHLLDDVERLCHRIGIIVAGRTVAEGSLAELAAGTGRHDRFAMHLDRPLGPDAVLPDGLSIVAWDDPWITVDLAPGTDPAGMWRALLFAGWPIREIHRDAGGLEALYLALTEGKAP